MFDNQYLKKGLSPAPSIERPSKKTRQADLAARAIRQAREMDVADTAKAKHQAETFLATRPLRRPK